MTQADWIAVDWGTTNLRVAAMKDTQVLAERQSDKGMGALARDGFEPALLALIGDWIDHRPPVIACGMVGSRQGWAEAAYRAAPCPPPGMAEATRVEARDPRLNLAILPGVMQASPADVMRGEETQIAGFLTQRPKFDGVLCLPGTHAKWVRISAGEIVSFQTFMTGEMYQLLAGQSVLRHSIDAEGWDGAAFSQALADALSRPQTVAASLFGIRAANLLAELGPKQARARLSGLLIGLELGGARPYWLGQDVAIIGAAQVAGIYQTALAEQGVAASLADAQDMTRAGLWSALKETTCAN